MSVDDADVEDDAGKTEGGGGQTDVACAFVAEARRLLVGDYLPKIERCAPSIWKGKAGPKTFPPTPQVFTFKSRRFVLNIFAGTNIP
jgi:hypothetical protein